MTRADRLRKELELLKLRDAEHAEVKGGSFDLDEASPSQPVAAPGPADVIASEPSRPEAFLRGAGQGITLGFGDEVNGGVQALMAKAMGEQGSLGELYERNRNTFRSEDAAADRAHHGYYVGGNIVGGAATGPLLPGGGAPLLAARGQGLTSGLGRALWEGVKTGAVGGGIAGFGQSNETTLGGMAKDAAIGAGAGATLGAVLPGVARAGQGVARGVRGVGSAIFGGGYVTPTPESVRLAQEGITLTLGQMDPASAFGRIEELAANKVTGGSISSARERAAGQTRDALLRRAGMPGATPPTGGAPVSQQLEELSRGFGQAYDSALENTVISPEKYLGQGKWRGLVADPTLKGAARMKGAFDLAAADKGIDASPGVRRRALEWMTNEAQSLVPAKSGPDAGMVDARSVQALRTRLRDRIRGLKGDGDDRSLREIYGRAEEFVSELLEGSLPPDKAATLRAADATYRNLLASEDAASRAFVQNQEFTPAQLLMSIRKRGATPDLESFAQDAQSVLSAKYAPTGIQVAANESIPLLNKVGPAWAAAANSFPTLQRHALGQTSMQQGLRAIGQAPAMQSIGTGTRTLAELLSMMMPRPQASLTRMLQPDGIGAAFPMGAVGQEQEDEPMRFGSLGNQPGRGRQP